MRPDAQRSTRTCTQSNAQLHSPRSGGQANEQILTDSDDDANGEEDGEISWQVAVRALLWSVYVPGTVRALGQQSLDPFVPLFAKRLGATVSEAGVVSSISFAANALCSPAAGVLVARTGENCAMLLGVAINGGAAVLGGLSPSVFGLSVSRGLTGAGNGIFQVGRQGVRVGVPTNPTLTQR